MFRLACLFSTFMCGWICFLSAQFSLDGTWEFTFPDGSITVEMYTPDGVGKVINPNNQGGEYFFVYKGEADGRMLYQMEGTKEGLCGNHIYSENKDFFQVGPNYEMFHYVYKGSHSISLTEIQGVKKTMVSTLHAYANSILMTDDGTDCYLIPR